MTCSESTESTTCKDTVGVTVRTVLLIAGDWLEMAALRSYERNLSIILSGGYSVGKKSIIMRFVYDLFFTEDNTMALNGGFSRL